METTPGSSKDGGQSFSLCGVRSGPKRLFLSLLATALLLLVLEGSSHVILSCRGEPEKAPDAGPTPATKMVNVFEYDPDLGWRYKPNLAVEDHYGPGLSMTTNSQGLRATREYDTAPPEGTYRILCAGDSVTMGFGVDDGDAFPAVMEASTPGLETINMGCGAYSAGQVYLRYIRDGLAFETDLLLFNVIGDDFRRMLPKNRAAGNAPKPILELRDGEIHAELMTPPAPEKPSAAVRFLQGLAVSRLLRDLAASAVEPDASERPYSEVSEAMFRDLAARSRKKDQLFAVVYIPTLGETENASFILDTWLVEFFASAGIPLVDLRAAFQAHPYAERRTFYLPDGHLSVRGNQVVAQALLAAARDLDPRCPR